MTRAHRGAAGPPEALARSLQARSLAPGMAVAVARDGQLLWSAAYGWASLELEVPASPATIFPIASVTKVYGAVLVMQAVQEGRLALDARLGELAALLPAPLPEAWLGATVRQLLSHTSGLPDLIADPLTPSWLAEELDDALAAAAALPMQFAPGSAWSYNQTNYVLLGLLLRGLAGETFEELVAERLLRPLGLAATRFGDARELVAGRGPWYTRLDLSGPAPRLAETLRPTWVTYPAFAHPCAGLNTNAAELATFVSAVGAGRLLEPATLEAMWQPPILPDGRPAGPDPSSAVALGWIVEELDGRKLVGGSGGGSVAFRHAVAERLTVAVLTNLQGANPDAMATELLAHWS